MKKHHLNSERQPLRPTASSAGIRPTHSANTPQASVPRGQNAAPSSAPAGYPSRTSPHARHAAPPLPPRQNLRPLPPLSTEPTPKKRKKKTLVSNLLLLAALICFAIAAYLIIKSIWVRHGQMKVRNQLLSAMQNKDFQPLLVDPKAWANDGEIIDVFIPDGHGGYRQSEQPADHGQHLDVNADGLVELQPIGRLIIDKIGVDIPVIEGLSYVNLRYGASRYEETDPIGQGRSAIFAHRSPLHGRDLNRLNEVQKGDHFVIATKDNVITYVVDQQIVVKPEEIFQYFKTNEKTPSSVLLVTCDPIPTWTHRMLVIAHEESRRAN